MPPRLNIPPVTRVLLVALVCQSVLCAAVRYRQWSLSPNTPVPIPFLTLVPQLSLWYPWTFVTSTLVENNVFALVISCLTLYHGGRYLERAWSSTDLAKFILICSLVPNLACFLVMVMFFSLTRNEQWTLVTIAGTIPLQIGFLVAFSQLVPAHTVTLFRGVLSLRVPRFPLLYIAMVALLSLTPLATSASLWLALFGFQTSWTYLRFYKRLFPSDLPFVEPSSSSSSHQSSSSSPRGDASETFAYAEFFPGPVKPLIAAIGDQLFAVLVALRLCTPFSAADVSSASAASARGGGANFMQRGAAPGSARAEAERRRALALKVLDQRLHAATASAAVTRSQQQQPQQQQQQQQPPPPPIQPSGPTVQSQPQPVAQTAMMSQPTTILGETSYNPDNESSEKAEP